MSSLDSIFPLEGIFDCLFACVLFFPYPSLDPTPDPTFDLTLDPTPGPAPAPVCETIHPFPFPETLFTFIHPSHPLNPVVSIIPRLLKGWDE